MREHFRRHPQRYQQLADYLIYAGVIAVLAVAGYVLVVGH